MHINHANSIYTCNLIILLCRIFSMNCANYNGHRVLVVLIVTNDFRNSHTANYALFLYYEQQYNTFEIWIVLLNIESWTYPTSV